MEKIKRGFKQELPAFRVYIEDIEYICAELRDHGWTDVKILTDDYRFDDPSELTKIDRTWGVTIDGAKGTGRSPAEHIYVDLNPRWPEIRTDDTSTEAWGVCEKIRRYLAGRRKPFGWAGSSEWVFAATVAFAVVTMALTATGLTLWAVLPLMGISLASLAALNARSTIILKRRSDAPTFWEKYREEWANQAITGAISLAIGGVGGYLIGKLEDKPDPAPAATAPATAPTTAPATAPATQPGP